MKHNYKLLVSLILATAQLSFAQIGRVDQMIKTTAIQVTQSDKVPTLSGTSKDVSRKYTVLKAKENLAKNFADTDRQKLVTKDVFGFGAFMNVTATTACTNANITQIQDILKTLTVDARYLNTTWVFSENKFFDARWMTGRGILATNDGKNELVVNIGRVFSDKDDPKGTTFTLDMSTREGESFMGATVQIYANAELMVKRDAQGNWKNLLIHTDYIKPHRTAIQINLNEQCYATGINTFDMNTSITIASDLYVIANEVGDFLGEGGMNAKVHDPYVQQLDGIIEAQQAKIETLGTDIENMQDDLEAKDADILALKQELGKKTALLNQAERDYQDLYATYGELYEDAVADKAKLEALRLYLDDFTKELDAAIAYNKGIQDNGGTLTVGSKDYKQVLRDFNRSIRVIKRNLDDMQEHGIDITADKETRGKQLAAIEDEKAQDSMGPKLNEIINATHELAKDATLLGLTPEQIKAALEEKGIDSALFDIKTIENGNRYQIAPKVESARPPKP